MYHQLRVLLVGRPGQAMSQLETLLGVHHQLVVTAREVGESPLLSDIKDGYDAIVLLVGEDWRETFERCFRPEAPANRPLLVVGPTGDMNLLRAAMRLGSRDFFSTPVGDDDLVDALNRLAKEEYDRHGALSARVTTFLNGKGGSGASFCAANFAHVLAKARGRRTVLMDFDLQFGSLPTYFNLEPRNSLLQALEMVDTIDQAALPGYTQVHHSGLHLLASMPEGIVLTEDIHEDRVGKLFGVLDQVYQELVIDMPRHIDRSTVAVLDRSDVVILVVQQTVAHLHEVRRLSSLLTRQLGIAEDRMAVVINRHQKQGEVTVADFQGALPGVRIETLQNDYQNVTQSINLGTPLLDLAPRAPISGALQQLVDAMSLGSSTEAGAAAIAAQEKRRGPWAWLSGAR